MASTAFLVDTNVLSELARPRPNDRVVTWAHTVVKVSLSVVTLEEIQFGLARSTSGDAATACRRARPARRGRRRARATP